MATDASERAMAARLLAASRSAIPTEEALARQRKRRERLLSPIAAQSISSPQQSEPMPVIDDPETYGRNFWNHRKAKSIPAKIQTNKPKRKKPTLVVDNDP
jgi:hypothetical protein